MSAASLRAKIVANCEWGITNSARIHYSEGPIRDDWLPKPLRTLPMTTDCSGFATACYKWAGAPDPNGLRYRKLGYTGTMLTHGVQVKTPQPGDLIIYGPPPGHHVVIYMYEWHGAWIVASHGGEHGPVRELQHQEEISQPAGKQIRAYLPRA